MKEKQCGISKLKRFLKNKNWLDGDSNPKKNKKISIKPKYTVVQCVCVCLFKMWGDYGN